MKFLNSNNDKNFTQGAAAVMISVFFAALSMSALVSAASDADEQPEVFNYSDGQRRNPFVPLIDRFGNRQESESNHLEELKIVKGRVVLNGILWEEKNPLVMINNKIYKRGDSIEDGLTVKNITMDTVELEYFELTYTISLIDKQKFE